MESKKRTRGPNFTVHERMLLLKILKCPIRKYQTVIGSRRTDSCSTKLKYEAWDSIAQRYNFCSSGPHRSPQQLKNAWRAMKKKASNFKGDQTTALSINLRSRTTEQPELSPFKQGTFRYVPIKPNLKFEIPEQTTLPATSSTSASTLSNVQVLQQVAALTYPAYGPALDVVCKENMNTWMKQKIRQENSKCTLHPEEPQLPMTSNDHDIVEVAKQDNLPLATASRSSSLINAAQESDASMKSEIKDAWNVDRQGAFLRSSPEETQSLSFSPTYICPHTEAKKGMETSQKDIQNDHVISFGNDENLDNLEREQTIIEECSILSEFSESPDMEIAVQANLAQEKMNPDFRNTSSPTQEQPLCIVQQADLNLENQHITKGANQICKIKPRESTRTSAQYDLVEQQRKVLEQVYKWRQQQHEFAVNREAREKKSHELQMEKEKRELEILQAKEKRETEMHAAKLRFFSLSTWKNK